MDHTAQQIAIPSITALLPLLLLLATGCPPPVPGEECASSADCPADGLCADGYCEAPMMEDAGPIPAADAAPDTSPPPRPGPTPDVCDADPVDLLFVIDNSASMTEEQESLAAALPHLIEVLATGDSNADGEREFMPVTDLRVGVITPDMGTGGHQVPTCLDSDFGDDAVLGVAGDTEVEGCAESRPPFLTWGAGDEAEAFVDEAACALTVGIRGCGFEQPLEAALKAVTTSSSDLRFVGDSLGQADVGNEGFFREGAVLAVVIVTDEEDCSTADPEIFNPASAVYDGNLNLRCHEYDEQLHAIERYVDGLLDARPAEDLVFAVIGGVPVDAVSADAPDYDAILAHPDMEAIADETMTGIVPSCEVEGRGRAFPPRRLVEVAAGLARSEVATTVQSICQADYANAVVTIADRVGASAGEFCERP